MTPLAWFLAWRERRRLARIAEAAERERAAIIRAREARRQKHMEFRYLDGDLRNATCRALAAECGRRWGAEA
jgi:hypothetical protein